MLSGINFSQKVAATVSRRTETLNKGRGKLVNMKQNITRSTEKLNIPPVPSAMKPREMTFGGNKIAKKVENVTLHKKVSSEPMLRESMFSKQNTKSIKREANEEEVDDEGFSDQEEGFDDKDDGFDEGEDNLFSNLPRVGELDCTDEEKSD